MFRRSAASVRHGSYRPFQRIPRERANGPQKCEVKVPRTWAWQCCREEQFRTDHRILSKSNRQWRSRGARYRGSPASMSIADHSRSWSMVTTFSGESKPAVAVITNAPDASSGGTENARAYASLPRKYRLLRKLNSSPSVTPVRRSRDAKSDSALGREGTRRECLRGSRGTERKFDACFVIERSDFCVPFRIR